jgi:nucleoside-diphosphate-sugar epimerase
MHVFITGATGYVGGAVADRLVAAGHAVHGLARSDAAAAALAARGIAPVRGELRDAPALAAAARAADAVIHAATTNGPDNPAADEAARRAVLGALAGTGRPFVYTSSVWLLGGARGTVLDDDAPPDPRAYGAWRIAGEREVLEADGVRGVVLRPAMVYGRGGCELVRWRVDEARALGAARTVGDGTNAWPLVHLDDVAAAYEAALAHAPPGARFNLATEHRTQREVAALGALADALALHQRVTAARARAALRWAPRGAGLAAELTGGAYAAR